MSSRPIWQRPTRSEIGREACSSRGSTKPFVDWRGACLKHRAARKLSFTGSTFVGRVLAREAADNLLRVSLELGGNNPFLVFEDADLDAAIEGAMLAKMRNVGEACTAANRFLVHRSVADAFAERLATRMSE
ncbi:MAG: aldehyde dehydrogenase family protein, partial [Rhizobiaceae bacterium]